MRAIEISGNTGACRVAARCFPPLPAGYAAIGLVSQCRTPRGMCLPALAPPSQLPLIHPSGVAGSGRAANLSTAGCSDQSEVKEGGLPSSWAGATARPTEKTVADGTQNLNPPHHGSGFWEPIRIRDGCEGCDRFRKVF